MVTPIVRNPMKYRVSPATSTNMDEKPIITIVLKSKLKKECHLSRINIIKRAYIKTDVLLMRLKVIGFISRIAFLYNEAPKAQHNAATMAQISPNITSSL